MSKSDRLGFANTVGVDGGQNVVVEADLVDILDIGVAEEEEVVCEDEVSVLSSFFTFHGFDWSALCLSCFQL